MKNPLFIVLFALIHQAFGGSERYLEIKGDTLGAYKQIAVLTDSAFKIEDSTVCKMEMVVPIRGSGSNLSTSVSSFKCQQEVVSEFTFLKFETNDMLVLFKPDGINFSKARFKRENLKVIHLIQDSDGIKNGVSEKGMDKVTGGIAVTTLVIIGIASVYFLILGRFINIL